VWENTVERGSGQMETWRMCCVWGITENTDPHWEYVLLIASLLQELLYDSASMLHYKYLTCLVCLFVLQLSCVIKMTLRIFEWSQVTLSSRYLVLFYLILMSCIWAIHQKNRTCIELNHWSRVRPGMWRFSHLLNTFSNFAQTKVKCPVQTAWLLIWSD
jgi:hypothetical protein